MAKVSVIPAHPINPAEHHRLHKVDHGGADDAICAEQVHRITENSCWSPLAEIVFAVDVHDGNIVERTKNHNTRSK